MRMFTFHVPSILVAISGSGVCAGVDTKLIQGGLTPGMHGSSSAVGLLYSSLGHGSGGPFANFDGFGFAHGSTPVYDDIQMSGPVGAPIDGISFSVVSFNDDGSTTGGTVTTNAVIGLFNAILDPDGSGLTTPDFTMPIVQITVPGLQIDSNKANIISIDVRDLNISMNDEVVWAGIFFTGTTGPANADASSLNDNVGQGVFGEATVGFSDDLAWDLDGHFFFGGADMGSPYANFGWQFGFIPTPGAMILFGLAGIAAMRRSSRASTLMI